MTAPQETRAEAPVSQAENAQQKWWKIENWASFIRPLCQHYMQHANRVIPALALVPVVAVIAAYHLAGLEVIADAQGKAFFEDMAVPLTVVAALLWLIRAAKDRSIFCLLVGLQAAVFCCREIHFYGTHKGVYYATGVIVIMMAAAAWRYRDRLRRPETVNWRQVSWLAASVATYALAILIQRRVFQHIPGEQTLHVPLEEATETMAHLLLLIAAPMPRTQK